MAELTKEDAVQKLLEMAKEVKALFPADFTTRGGTLFHTTINNVLNEAIEKLNSPFSKPQFVVDRFYGQCDSWQRIAKRKASKGWK